MNVCVCVCVVCSYSFPGGASGKESACQCERHTRHKFRFLGREDPLEEGMSIHSRILAWRSPTVIGLTVWQANSLQGLKESDTIEVTQHSHTYICVVTLETEIWYMCTYICIGIKPRSLAWRVDSLPFKPPGEPINILHKLKARVFVHTVTHTH